MIKVIEGNIIDSKTDFIIHQVNCKGEMNSGVAKALRDFDERIYIHYRWMCGIGEFNPEYLLGTYDPCVIKNGTQTVLSLFAQDDYGYDGKQYTNVEAFKDGLCFISRHIPEWCEEPGKDIRKTSIALPYKIGCGRGGADWNVIYKIIEKELANYEVELWKLDAE